jgi:tetratricopeptide (TPR) repeat protein
MRRTISGSLASGCPEAGLNTAHHRLPHLHPALAGAVLAALLLPAATFAIPAPQGQTQQGLPTGPSLSGGATILTASGVLTLTITDQHGGLLNTQPSISITDSINRIPILTPPFQSGDSWEFRGVPTGGEYIVSVAADGYESQQQYVNLANVAGAEAQAVFRLRKLPTNGTGSGDAGHFILAPRAQKEVQKGLKDLRSNKPESAVRHLNKALQLAPGNPAVNYLVAVGYLQTHQASQAVPYLEKALSIDPDDVDALVTLGGIRYEQGDNAGAIDLLAKAVTAAPDRWQAQWMLASAYLREKKYKEARDHAELALKAGKDKAERARLVLGEAQAELGNRTEAAVMFEEFLKQNPDDPNASRVREWVKQLREARPVKQPAPAPAPATAEPKPGSDAPTPLLAATLPARPAVAVPVATWLPPDVDATHPAIISGEACPLSQVLRKAGNGTGAFINDLVSFSATEEFQTAAISRQGKVDYSYERKFNYLLFVRKTGPHRLSIEEVRDRQFDLPNMGGPVIESGSAALALIFHSDYRGDFEWNCEGLGEWRGASAWVVHFQQRHDRPVSQLAGFDTADQVYPLALKGRAWLERKSGRVLHLDADLIRPIPQVQLNREHFVIDYKEVKFTSHPVQLWLPEDVHIYIQYRGHGFHQYHHFDHFQLFWVGTAQKISQPKHR